MTTSPFAALHDALFVLPNAWDVTSARALAAHGFPAVGTTSLGIAAAHGLPDGEGATLEATAALVRALRHRTFLLTADLEGGADGIEELVAELEVDGVNIEDGRGPGRLAPPAEQAARVAAIKARAPGVFVNARVDTWWLGVAQHETIDRVRTYVDAGADGVFVPGLPVDEIQEVVAAAGVPINVLAQADGPSLADLAARGVRRVSTGSLLYRAALGAALDIAGRQRDAGALGPVDAPSYASVTALSAPAPETPGGPR